MNRHDRLRAWPDRALESFGASIECIRVCINEYRLEASVMSGGCATVESECRNDDFIAGLRIKGQGCQEQSERAIRCKEDMLYPKETRQFLLKDATVRTFRQPSAVNDCRHQLALHSIEGEVDLKDLVSHAANTGRGGNPS